MKNSWRRVLLVIVTGCIVFPLAATQWAKHQRPPAPIFKFPTKELEALDRDLQARFAVVPEKDFGIERAYGRQHYLYNPTTVQEKETIRKLKAKNTEVAFYLMSRALWQRRWDGWGYKPIQGPIAVTGSIKAPLPRQINFEATNRPKGSEIIDQETGFGIPDPDQDRPGLPTHNPAGTPVPSPTPPSNAPGYNQLQFVGNSVFEASEGTSAEVKVGSTTVWKDWKVVAVPIRASQPACLNCHNAHNSFDRLNRGKKVVEVGDALGVAFYAYRRSPALGKATPTKRPSIR